MKRKHRQFLFLLALVSAMVVLGLGVVEGKTLRGEKASAAQTKVAFAQLPLRFEANEGQTAEEVKFLSHGRGYTLFLTPTEAVLALRKPEGSDGSHEAESLRGISGKHHPPTESSAAVLRMKLVGSNPKPHISGLEQLPGKSNYLIGNDPKKWRASVPSYTKVKYEQAYPGVDLIYYGNKGLLEYDFVVAPGADPTAIGLELEGADKVEVDQGGDLIVHAGGGHVHLRKPLVYQDVAGARRHVSAEYVLKGNKRVAFKVAAHDESLALIIDPVLSYSTYLGGSQFDGAWCVAVDGSGNAYVYGTTLSVDFPTTDGAFQPASAGNRDGFIAKLDSTGSALVYCTYVGGSADESDGGNIEVDSLGNAWATGQTCSTDFPITEAAFQRSNAGDYDAFALKLDPSGSALVYSTYLGGSDAESAFSMGMDGLGNLYVTGQTFSDDFPTCNAFQPDYGGWGDAFVFKLDSTGSLLYSTYLGGSDHENSGWPPALDGSGNAYVTGVTHSTDFPTTDGVIQRALRGNRDAFIASSCCGMIF